MIIEKITEAKKRKIKQWPVRSNRASELGHDCERYLVYRRSRWQDLELHDERLQAIFDEGNRQERATIEDLQEAGFEILHAQRPFEAKKQDITGHIDFALQIEGRIYPVEVKGLSPFTWDKINSFEDLLESDKTYVRKYASQIQLYLYLSDFEEGFLLIRNKLTAQYKEIPVTLDYAFAEGLLQKAERINKHVADETLPEKINQYDVCKECPARHFCSPDVDFGAGLQLVDDTTMEGMIEAYLKLKPFANDYAKLEKKIKEIHQAKDIGEYMYSDKYVVEIIPYTRTNYEMPPEIKDQYAVKKEYTKVKVKEVGGGE